MSMVTRYPQTTLFIIDSELYNWAQYRAKTLGYASVSEYMFDLMKLDREQVIVKERLETRSKETQKPGKPQTAKRRS